MAEVMLDCVICGGRKWRTLDTIGAEELRSTGATRAHCETCNRETYWKTSDYGRRTGNDRRAQREDPKPQTVDPNLGIERIALQPPPDRERYRQAGAQILQEKRTTTDRRQAFNRNHGRVPLRLPVMVRVSNGALRFEEVTETLNVSRTGVYFQTARPYEKGTPVQVTLNYSPMNPTSGIEQPGTVVRIDPDPVTRTKGVAVFMAASKAEGQ